MLSLLPPELLLEITSQLNFRQLTFLLLTGNRLLTIKLQHGGVDRLDLELAYPAMGKAHYGPNTIGPKNFADFSRSICFTALKSLKTVIIEGFQTFKPDSVLSVAVGALKLENIVELYLSTSDSLRVFIPAKYHSTLFQKSLFSVPSIWSQVRKLESQNGKELDLWLPISEILPSIKSLQVYSFIHRSKEADFSSTILKYWANFQRLLPLSLTEFGCNIHRGDIKELLDTLPPRLTSLKFDFTVQLNSSHPPSVFPLCNLRTIKDVAVNLYDLIPKGSLTSVIYSSTLPQNVYLPPTLTELSLRFSHRIYPLGWEKALPRGIITLHLPDTIEVAFGQLPRSLLHLSCRAMITSETVTDLPPNLITLFIGAVETETTTFPKIATHLLSLQHLSLAGRATHGIWYLTAVDPSIITELPPKLTKLDISIPSIPAHFSGFTCTLKTLTFPGLSITETQYEVLFPSNITNFTCAKVKLQGLAASRDPTILHLSRRAILGAFMAFVKTQGQAFGRTLFVNEFLLSDNILALSPSLQSISRKLPLGELNQAKLLPRSLTKLNSFCQVSLADCFLLPPSLTTYKYVRFEADDEILGLLKNDVKEEKRIVLPQSLVPLLAQRLCLPHDDFCFEEDILGPLSEATASLRSYFPSMTELSLSVEKVTVNSPKFWNLPNLKALNLVLYRDNEIENIAHIFSGFQSLTSLSLRMDVYFLKNGFQVLPRSLTSFTLSGRRCSRIRWSYMPLPPKTLETLPPNLTSLVIEHICPITEVQVLDLPKSLTRVKINSGGYD